MSKNAARTRETVEDHTKLQISAYQIKQKETTRHKGPTHGNTQAKQFSTYD